MAELKKRWSDGELLTVTYDGDRDGSATFTSDANESLDREMVVTYVDKDKKVSVAQMVKQEGLREVFNASDGDFILADGGTFNVLKNELQ
jgi:protein associated with RNAse G/E